MGFGPSPLLVRKIPSTSRMLAATTEMPEGLVKTVTKPGNGPPLKLGDVATVKYSCYLSDEAPFARSEFQKVVRCGLRTARACVVEKWNSLPRRMQCYFTHTLIILFYILIIAVVTSLSATGP